MTIVSAVGVAAGSSDAVGSGGTRPQSAATATRAAFSQEEFRTVIWKSTPVRDQYGKVARDTKKDPIVSYFDNLEDAQIIVDERGALLGAHARRFRVVIDELMDETDLGFATALPGATFIDDELVADMPVAVTAIESVDYNSGQTTLLVWGIIGEWAIPGGGTAPSPPPDRHIHIGKGTASGTSSAVGVAVNIKPSVGVASGSSSADAVGVGVVPAVGAAAGTSAAQADGLELGIVLTSGDMQGGTDKILLSGDMQSGTDHELFGD